MRNGHGRLAGASGRVASALVVAAGLVGVGGFGGEATAQVVSAQLLAKVGDVLPGTAGLTATTLNDPYTDGQGRVGFTGNSSGGNFVWYNTGVTFLSSNGLPDTLTGAEGTMGVSNTGGFVYSPSVNGNDAVWTQAGKLLAAGDSIPSLGLFSTFNSRPRMDAAGGAYWVSGLAATSGGTATNRAMLYAANPAAPNIQAVLIGGGTYGGVDITTSASNFAYDVSSNGLHRVHVLTATGAAATDSFVYKSSTDTVIAREGSAVPGFPSELYVAFRIPGVNNAGNWVIAADTNAATSMDEIIVYNDTVIAREGNVIGGVTLAGATNAISINNLNRVAVIYNGATGIATETLFAGPATDFLGSGHVVLKVGDQIDINNDNACDFTVSDFNASNTIAPGLDIADDGMIWVNVDLTPCGGGTAVEAIIGVRDVTPPSCPADFNGVGGVTVQDIFDFLAAWFSNAPNADFNGVGGITVQDIFDFLAAWFTGCP